MDVLRLRFQGPFMSFGGPLIDDHGPTGRFPVRSMIVGIFGHACGLPDPQDLERLQRRLRYAVRCDREGHLVTDFQTVDISRPKASRINHAGIVSERDDRFKFPLVRLREYLADAVYHLAVTLVNGEGPSLDLVQESLINPQGILFLGRKACIPSAPLFVDRVQAGSLVEALQTLPSKYGKTFPARWPCDEGPQGRQVVLTEDLDWANRIHVGERIMQEGTLEVAS